MGRSSTAPRPGRSSAWPTQRGIGNIAASRVSEFNKGLDAQSVDFKARPLAEEHPFLWSDAMYQKVRVDGRVVSMADIIAHGVNPADSQENIALELVFDKAVVALFGYSLITPELRHLGPFG